MRAYMRARTVDGVNATEILERVGLDEQTLDDMYRIMALANYDSLIPIDEVVDTMDKVGHAIDSSLRCTALGGLSITKTAKEIEARLQSPATQTNQKLSC